MSVSIALTIAPASNDVLAAALSRELDQPSASLRLTQQNVEAADLAATNIIEQWKDADAFGRTGSI